MRLKSLTAVTAIVTLAACQQAAAPAAEASIAAAATEADATAAFDNTVAGWMSMDAAKVKALYAPDVAGFDYAAADIVMDRATWDANQDAFAEAKFDKAEVKAKKIQLLGPDSFVVTSLSEVTSTANPENAFTFRCTDIYQRQADGAFLISNEHCSGPPEA